MKSFNNILIVGAHFDDSELGAGGTAAKLAAEGKNVYKSRGSAVEDRLFMVNHIGEKWKWILEQTRDLPALSRLKTRCGYRLRPCTVTSSDGLTRLYRRTGCQL